MRHILILGAGTAGTMMANRLSRRLRSRLRRGIVNITVVDPDPVHLYQPGLLFIPFAESFRERITRPRAPTLDRDVRYIPAAITRIDPDAMTVALATGERISYDLCIIATGARLAPEATDGMAGPHWGHSVHEFYTLGGSEKLAYALDRFVGGRLLIHVVDTPIKCPTAPLEFAFLADAYFTNCGIRDKVEITFVTPLAGASEQPACASSMAALLAAKDIRLETDFATERVETNALVGRDGRVLPFNLLVTVPTHRGARFIGDASGLGDANGFVKVDPHTLQSARHPSIFALGDAANCPTAKMGSVAHFQAEVLEENVVRVLEGALPEPSFDGHANGFVETGHRKALLIDFNYATEPLPGRFPFFWGPAPLLKESRLNHIGKLAFRHLYWNAILPGRELLGIPSRMRTAGKRALVGASG